MLIIKTRKKNEISFFSPVKNRRERGFLYKEILHKSGVANRVDK